MPKLFAICPIQGGQPNASPLVAGVDFKGYVLCDQIGGTHGGYLFSGTGPQLTAINAIPTVIGIVVVNETVSKWPELDNVITAGVRTTLNAWLTARSITNIPAGWTNRQTITAVYQRLNARFSIDGMDVTE